MAKINNNNSILPIIKNLLIHRAAEKNVSKVGSLALPTRPFLIAVECRCGFDMTLIKGLSAYIRDHKRYCIYELTAALQLTTFVKSFSLGTCIHATINMYWQVTLTYLVVILAC